MTTLDTSAQSYRAIGLRAMAAKQLEIYNIVKGCQIGGQPDMSLTEIRDTFERLHGVRIDLNRVSSRVSELVAAKRLHRQQESRACSVSGRQVHAVLVPATQARLVA